MRLEFKVIGDYEQTSGMLTAANLFATVLVHAFLPFTKYKRLFGWAFQRIYYFGNKPDQPLARARHWSL